MGANQTCIEIHDTCFDARDGMSGALDYGVVLRIMDLMGIEGEEQLEIFDKIMQVERKLREWQKEKDK